MMLRRCVGAVHAAATAAHKDGLRVVGAVAVQYQPQHQSFQYQQPPRLFHQRVPPVRCFHATTSTSTHASASSAVMGVVVSPRHTKTNDAVDNDGSGSSANASDAALNFDDGRAAYSHKSTWHLVRSLAVLKLCTVQSLVDHSLDLVKLGERVVGKALTYGVLRHTFFAHFCAGETADDIGPSMRALEAANIGGILDYAAEADVSSVGEADQHDELECDLNAKISVMAIEAAAKQNTGFAAIKLTSLGRPELLHHISTLLVDIRKLFRKFTEADNPGRNPYLYNQVTFAQFEAGLKELGVDLGAAATRERFDAMDHDKSGSIDYIEWIDQLKPATLARQRLQHFVRVDMLSEAELTQLDNMIARLEMLGEKAAEAKVRLMIDAEQSYMQPAIDHMVLHLQKRYNKPGEVPIIFNTYQAYLVDARPRIELDIRRAERDGFRLACKLVRGAYMVQERQLAKEHGYISPVWSTLEGTHASYHTCLELLFDHLPDIEVLVASHNEDSVKFAVDMMSKRGIPAAGGGVYFGQLLGMCDHVTNTLGARGYQVYKYVPYGPIDEVLPYLIRRAQENSGLLGSAAKERQLMWDEVKRRLL